MNRDMENNDVLSEYKKYYVYKKINGKYYYPPTLPRVRSSLGSILIIGVSIMFFAGPLVATKIPLLMCLYYYFYFIMVLFLYKIIQRFLLYFEESKHLLSRYDGSRKKLLHELIQLPKKAWFLFVVTISVVTCSLFDKNKITSTEIIFDLQKMFFSYIISVFLLEYLLQMDSSILHLSLWISQNHGLDYGTSMAYSYYHGYLKLVLNQQGDTDRNLVDGMTLYEDKEHIKFEFKKLFILIPKSMNCLDNLEDASQGTMENAKSLLEKEITRAGVRKRVYKNSVYKIQMKNSTKITYVVAEYASPLKTSKEVISHIIGKHSYIYKELQNDIIHKFYTTLKQILDENDLRDVCDLIYYEDLDENKKLRNVGKLLLHRIRQIQKKED